jgi:integrase
VSASLDPGRIGRIWTTVLANGKHKARTRVGGLDGRSYEVSAIGKDRRAAERHLHDRILARTQREQLLLSDPDALTVEQVATAWLASRQGVVKASTLAQYRACLDQVILPEIGQQRMSTMTRAFLMVTLDRIAAGQRTGKDKHGKPRAGRPVTGRQPAVVMAMLTKYAWTRGILGHDPLARRGDEGTRKPKHDPDRPVDEDGDELRHLSDEECVLLAKVLAGREHRDHDPARPQARRAADPALRHIAGLMLGTGLRIGEAVALRWRDVEVHGDWERVTVWVTGTFVEPRGEHVPTARRGRPKGKASIRAVTPGPEVAAMLRGLYENTPFKQPDHPVVASRRGTMLWTNNLRTRWRKALEGTALEGITPHVLRRTFGERVRLAHGIDAAQKALGHTSRATTEAAYTREAVRPVPVRFTTPPGLLPAVDRIDEDEF